MMLREEQPASRIAERPMIMGRKYFFDGKNALLIILLRNGIISAGV